MNSWKGHGSSVYKFMWAQHDTQTTRDTSITLRSGKWMARVRNIRII